MAAPEHLMQLTADSDDSDSDDGDVVNGGGSGGGETSDGDSSSSELVASHKSQPVASHGVDSDDDDDSDSDDEEDDDNEGGNDVIPNGGEASPDKGSDDGADSNDDDDDDKKLHKDIVKPERSPPPGAPPKKKIRLSLRLPTKDLQSTPAKKSSKAAPRTPPSKPKAIADASSPEAVVVSATIVSSNDDETDQGALVVPVVSSSSSKSSKHSLSSAGPSSSASKKPKPKASLPLGAAGGGHHQPAHTRPIRLPAIISPGLLMPSSALTSLGGPANAGTNGNSSTEAQSSAGSGKGSKNSKLAAYIPPSLVFDKAMTNAGYTEDARTSNPHRGSSVRRVVGDLFDTDILLAHNFQSQHELVPSVFLRHRPSKKSSKDDAENGLETKVKDLFLSTFSRARPPSKGSKRKGSKKDDPSSTSHWRGKRRRGPLHFSDTIPTSLTTSSVLPDSFLDAYRSFTAAVAAREEEIIKSQDAADAAEDANDRYEDAKEEWTAAMSSYNARNGSKGENEDESPAEPPPPMPKPPPIPAPLHVPPIPEPPSPPYSHGASTKSREPDDTNSNASDKESLRSTKQIIPKSAFVIGEDRKHLVNHLDPNCFDIGVGRYYGLMSNEIADPQFVGPNAPGLANINVAGGTGLATSYVSSGGGGGGHSSSNSSNSAAPLGAVSSNPGAASVTPVVSSKSGGGGSKKESAGKTGASAKAKSAGVSPSSSSAASSQDLKRFMEASDPGIAEEMRMSIVRASVYASRTGKHGGGFVAANGQTYVDIGRAFAMYGNIRPCARCKSNKQGSYHCRLRRKHRDPDFDGGNSVDLIIRLFDEPMESLLVDKPNADVADGKPSKKK